jgi:hypothetical protein
LARVGAVGRRGGGSVLAAPGGMNDTDTIHNSGNRLTIVKPTRTPLTIRATSDRGTAQLRCRDRYMSVPVTAKINPNSKKATADAVPRFHHLKPSSYMK